MVDLAITTRARTGIVTPWSYRPLLPLLFLLLTALAGVSLRHRREPGRRLKPAFILTGFLLLAALSGCGGWRQSKVLRLGRICRGLLQARM